MKLHIQPFRHDSLNKMLQKINNDISIHIPRKSEKFEAYIGDIHAVHTRFQSPAACCRVVIPHLIKWLVQIVADIPLGIELVHMSSTGTRKQKKDKLEEKMFYLRTLWKISA